MINIKIFSTLTFILFFSFEGVSQKVNAFDENGKRHGNWKKYYENGNLRYTGNFEHGKEVGMFMYFDMISRKHPTVLKIFTRDSDIAKVEYYTTKGDLRSRGEMKGRNRIGKWVYYFPSGKLFSEEHYVDGKLDGLLVNYYPSGKKTEETYYKNGQKSGLSKKYSDEGVLIEEISYANGKANGVAKFFDLKGNLLETGAYEGGKRVGRWEFFDNGEVISKKEKRNKKTHTIPKE